MEIIGKLPASGEVVTSGQSQLADGTPVRIKTPEEADDAGKSNTVKTAEPKADAAKVKAAEPKVDAAKTAPVAK